MSSPTLAVHTMVPTSVAPMATKATRPRSGVSMSITERLLTVNTSAWTQFTAIGLTVSRCPGTSVIETIVPATGAWYR